jgi:hypothetical protein
MRQTRPIRSKRGLLLGNGRQAITNQCPTIRSMSLLYVLRLLYVVCQGSLMRGGGKRERARGHDLEITPTHVAHI